MEVDKKYMVYKSDIKYRAERKIDPDKANFYDEDVKKMFYNENHDTIQFRLKEASLDNYKTLNFSNLRMTEFPSLSSTMYDKINYLFLSDNNLSGTLDLSKFKNLVVVDISNNLISEISGLSPELTELVCHDNLLTKIEISEGITRLNCANNKLSDLPPSDNLINLVCSGNKLSDIKAYPKLTTLVCDNNPIMRIDKLPRVKTIDCSETNISVFDCRWYPQLKTFYCNDSSLQKLGLSNVIETIEIYNTNVTNLDYSPSLRDLVCFGTTKISKDYKIARDGFKLHKGKYFMIQFESV